MEAGFKDHYISRTYLKKFCDETDQVWVYNKKYLGIKHRYRKAICHRKGWSDNHFLENPRIIEEYLKHVEPYWAKNVEVFSSNEILPFEDYSEVKYMLAGYIAYLKVFPPAMARVGQSMLASLLHTTMKIMQKSGEIPPPPKELEFILEDLEKHIKVDVDEKYPLALGVQAIVPTLNTLSTSPWLKLINKTDIPFITSDNPACGWFMGNAGIAQTYVPLTPRIAVLIHPQFGIEVNQELHIEDGIVELDLDKVKEFNQLICRNAENIVISNIKSNEIRDCVKENQNWECTNVSTKFPLGRGEIVINQWKAVEKAIR